MAQAGAAATSAGAGRGSGAHGGGPRAGLWRRLVSQLRPARSARAGLRIAGARRPPYRRHGHGRAAEGRGAAGVGRRGLSARDPVDPVGQPVGGRGGTGALGDGDRAGHRRGVTAAEARKRFAAARVARLATADAGGRPHVVPIVFAVDGDRVYSVVDAKPKRTLALRRLRNVAENPRVALLVDHYQESWSALWWVRAEGMGRVLDPASEVEAERGEAARAV